MHTAIMTGWHSMQKRAEEKVAKALRRREVAEYMHQQAVAELERVKRERRAAEAR